MTKKTIEAARAAELAAAREKIDALLAPLVGLSMLDKHHMALLAHVRKARNTMTRARDLSSAAECADELNIVYTRREGRNIARVREWLADRPNKPFAPKVDLPGSLSFM